MAEIEMEFAIRPYDVDVAGIVSNIVYVRWLEDLRMELLNKHLPPDYLREQNLMPVIARTEIDYRLSLRFSDGCTGRMRVTGLGRTSMIVRAVFRNREKMIVAEAKQVGVFVNTNTGRPSPLPDEVRANFEKDEKMKAAGGRVK